VIICANHLGWTDVLLVTLFLPVEPRIFVVGDKGVKNVSRFLRFMVENFGVIQLDRGKPIEALRTMKSVIVQGGSLLIFPEGNLGTEEGALLPLQNGAAHVSVQTGAPVLPVGLTGTSKLWLRRHLTVRIGVPMRADAPDTGSLHSRLDEFTGRIGMAMQSLMPGDDDLPKVRLMEKRLTELF
jgi:1-acyl-sn-glycerol-3-phosphate acyltransferase